MSIPVTCPECDSHFHVGDEFAGKPGRCPECAAVIEVPDPDKETDTPPERVDPHPFWTPRGVEAFEEMPSRSREPRAERPLDPMQQHRADYAEPRPRFDPAARAAKWKAVAHGLRNLMVAVTLIAVDELVGTSFLLVDGVKEAAQQQNFGPREKALIIGHGLIAGLCILMWMFGRIGCARVPYVPARRLAVPAGVIAGLTGMTGLIGMTLFILGFAMLQQGNMAGFGLAGIGECALLPAMFGFVIAEVLGVWSQIRMAEGLHDLTFGRTSKVMMTVLVLLTSLVVCGSCLLFMLVVAAVEKANQKQQQQLQQQQQQPAPIVQPAEEPPPNDPAPAKKGIEDNETKKTNDGQASPRKDQEPKKKDIGPKDKDVPPVDAGKAEPKKKDAEQAPPVVKNAQGPAGKKGQGQQQPPPPEIDPAEHPEVVYGITIFALLIALTYAGFCLVCFQSGRRAIQREIQHLVGNPHDHDDHHGGRY
jgi:type II secretory pathway component PulM